MAQPIIAGNWKMNHNAVDGLVLIRDVVSYCEQQGTGKAVVLMAPPMLYLTESAKAVRGALPEIAAQNCHYEDSGAYTGEISAAMLAHANIGWAIIGHSERRQYFQETGELLNAKLKACFRHHIKPILCVGEHLEDRKAKRQEAVVKSQLDEALKGLSTDEISKLVIAYEPVWAIGTGETASPEQAQEMHAFIRNWLKSNQSEQIANDVSILYGGSVKPANAAEIFGQPDVDGGLIGGASLKADSFTELIRIGAETL